MNHETVPRDLNLSTTLRLVQEIYAKHYKLQMTDNDKRK